MNVNKTPCGKNLVNNIERIVGYPLAIFFLSTILYSGPLSAMPQSQGDKPLLKCQPQKVSEIIACLHSEVLPSHGTLSFKRGGKQVTLEHKSSILLPQFLAHVSQSGRYRQEDLSSVAQAVENSLDQIETQSERQEAKILALQISASLGLVQRRSDLVKVMDKPGQGSNHYQRKAWEDLRGEAALALGDLEAVSSTQGWIVKKLMKLGGKRKASGGGNGMVVGPRGGLQKKAVEALGKIKTPESGLALVGVAESNPSLASSAAISLAQVSQDLGDDQFAMLRSLVLARIASMELGSQSYDEVLDSFANLGARAIPDLLDMVAFPGLDPRVYSLILGKTLYQATAKAYGHVAGVNRFSFDSLNREKYSIKLMGLTNDLLKDRQSSSIQSTFKLMLPESKSSTYLLKFATAAMTSTWKDRFKVFAVALDRFDFTDAEYYDLWVLTNLIGPQGKPEAENLESHQKALDILMKKMDTQTLQGSQVYGVVLHIQANTPRAISAEAILNRLLEIAEAAEEQTVTDQQVQSIDRILKEKTKDLPVSVQELAQQLVSLLTESI